MRRIFHVHKFRPGQAGLAGEQNQRSYLGRMSRRSLSRILHTRHPRSAKTDAVAIYAGLRDEVFKRCVKVLWPFLSLEFGAVIDGEHVDAGRRELCGQIVP